MAEEITQTDTPESRAQWASALALGRANSKVAPGDMTVTTPIVDESGNTLEMITADNVLAYGEATGRTWNTLRSGFQKIATSSDDKPGYNTYQRHYVDGRGRQATFVAITPDHLANVLAKQGRYGVPGASEKTVELLADLLAHYSSLVIKPEAQ